MRISLIDNKNTFDKTIQGKHKNNSADFSKIVNTKLITNNKKELNFLGTITEKKPTVSHILIKHPNLGKDCWKIVYSKNNRNKDFTKLQAGTKIFIDPETRELVWNKNNSLIKKEKYLASPVIIPPEGNQKNKTDFLSSNLVNAVKSFLGKTYDEINCYELVVRGLKELGIKYQGKGGLKSHLVKMAKDKGLPINSFLNGEGLTKLSGTDIYSKTISKVKRDYKCQANEIINEIKHFLEQGLILSFSTQTKGHTGIISQKDDTWTFINSGTMDNNILPGNNSKSVGEENLYEEIKNWFKLAYNRHEPLHITAGRLNENKLQAFFYHNNIIEKKI